MVSPGLKVVPIQFDLAGRDDISIYDLKAAAIQFDFSEGVSRALMFARSHFLTLSPLTPLTDRVDLSSC